MSPVAFSVQSRSRSCFCNITSETKELVHKCGVEEGVCILFVPHTTCALTLCENSDPDVKRDILFAMDRFVPNVDFKHFEGNSDSHTKSSTFGFSLMLLIQDGEILLGRWQDIYLADFDGPRTRTVYVKVMAG